MSNMIKIKLKNQSVTIFNRRVHQAWIWIFTKLFLFIAVGFSNSEKEDEDGQQGKAFCGGDLLHCLDIAEQLVLS